MFNSNLEQANRDLANTNAAVSDKANKADVAGTVLFTSAANTQEAGNYNLNDNVNNYRCIDIIICDLAPLTNYTVMRLYNGYYNMQAMRPYVNVNNQSILQTYWRYIGFSGTTMSLGIGNYRNYDSQEWTKLSDLLVVRKVIGYK